MSSFPKVFKYYDWDPFKVGFFVIVGNFVSVFDNFPKFWISFVTSHGLSETVIMMSINFLLIDVNGPQRMETKGDSKSF